MHFSPAAFDLRGLRTQVLLWTVLPLTILLIVFSVSSISSHQQSMRALAADENGRLVTALSQLVTLKTENRALHEQIALDQVSASDLALESLLDVRHDEMVVTVALLDRSGKLLFGKGDVPAETALTDWPGAPEALSGQSGVLFSDESNAGDVVAYAPVSNTNWVLLLREPWHSLTDPLIRFEQVIPPVMLAAVVISLLALFFGVRYVVQPLRVLRLRADQIGQGQFDAAAQPVSGVTEIEALRATLNEMAQRIRSDQGALQDYLRAVTTAQEAERERIARELHDETVQTLIALGHKAQMAQRTLARDPEQTPARIGELREMITQAIEEVRRFSKALHPYYLEELGLTPALETLAREAQADFQVYGSPYRLKSEKELAIFRIAQEALNNARRHAQAQTARVEISFEAEEVVLIVRDDGQGFVVPADLSHLTHSGHFGLIGMRERSQLVSGRLQVESQPAGGATITFTLDRA